MENDEQEEEKVDTKKSWRFMERSAYWLVALAVTIIWFYNAYRAAHPPIPPDSTPVPGQASSEASPWLWHAAWTSLLAGFVAGGVVQLIFLLLALIWWFVLDRIRELNRAFKGKA